MQTSPARARQGKKQLHAGAPHAGIYPVGTAAATACEAPCLRRSADRLDRHHQRIAGEASSLGQPLPEWWSLTANPAVNDSQRLGVLESDGTSGQTEAGDHATARPRPPKTNRYNYTQMGTVVLICAGRGTRSHRGSTVPNASLVYLSARPRQVSYGDSVNNPGKGVEFAGLACADLVVDRYYFGGRAGNSSDDPIARLLPVGNQGGFRPAGSPRAGNVRLAVLFSTGRDPDWPDQIDERNGIVTYYGDNKTPGHELLGTTRGGNALLRDVFALCNGTPADRWTVPPFLMFTSTGNHRDVRFRGLLAPGSATSGSDEGLQAIWRGKDGLRFQNYRARFTILDEVRVSRGWLADVLAGTPDGASCPPAWRQWAVSRTYRPLLPEPTPGA